MASLVVGIFNFRSIVRKSPVIPWTLLRFTPSHYQYLAKRLSEIRESSLRLVGSNWFKSQRIDIWPWSVSGRRLVATVRGSYSCFVSFTDGFVVGTVSDAQVPMLDGICLSVFLLLTSATLDILGSLKIL